MGRIRRFVSRVVHGVTGRPEPTGLAFAFADRISGLRPDHWDQATGSASVFLQRDFLACFQDHGPSGLAHRFALVYRGDRPVAAFTTQTLELTASQVVQVPDDLPESDRATLALKSLTRKALDEVRRRVTVCGGLATYGPHGVAFAPGEDPAALWPAVAEGLYRLRRAAKLEGDTDYTVIKELPDERSQGEALSALGYHPMPVDPSMVLEVDPAWGDFSGYLAALNKKYRKAAAKVAKDLEAGGGWLEPIPPEALAREGARIHALYRAVADGSKFRLLTLPEAFFPALAEALGPERVRLLGIRRDTGVAGAPLAQPGGAARCSPSLARPLGRAAGSQGELVGWVSVLRDRDTAYGYYLGIDYQANADLPIYHRLLQAVVETGIEWRVARISYGGTALDAKARLGCRPVKSSAWVRHRVPVLESVVRRVLAAVPHPEAPDRNPFAE